MIMITVLIIFELCLFLNFREGLVIIRKELQYGPPKQATFDTTTWS